jgi:anoctamin-10
LFSGEATEAQIVEANVLDYEVKMVKRDEWLGRFQIVKTNTVVFAGILCVQLPFELLYAHLNRAAPYAFLKYILTGLYILAIQFFTKKGGQIAVKLTKSEKLGNKEAAANDLIYKVFGIYFMQSYVGLFYQAFFHREFDALRSVLAQRLIITQLLSNVSENLVPYATYRYTKFKAMK